MRGPEILERGKHSLENLEPRSRVSYVVDDTRVGHSSDVPSCAPAIEDVAIPDGSLSAEPVVKPGPSTDKKRLSGFFLARRGIVRVIERLCLLAQIGWQSD
jgi:hypothetical protein